MHVVAGAGIAAAAGEHVGYLLGSRVGRSLFSRPGSRLFRPEHLRRAQASLEQGGARVMVLAASSAVRRFTPIVAGTSDMAYRVLVPYNVVGAVLWGRRAARGGLHLGSRVAHMDRCPVPTVAAVIVVSFIPVVIELRRARHRNALA